MRSWGKTLGLAAALAILIAGGLSARADGVSPGGYVGGLKLVWGSVPLPDFRTGLQQPTTSGGGLTGDEPSYAMMLSLSDNPKQHFVFTPRTPQLSPLGLTGGGTQRSYLGLSVDIGDATGFYGSLGLGGSVLAQRTPAFEEAGPRAYNAPFMLHGGVELGYRLDRANSFSLSVEEARPTDGSERGGPIGTYRLRYGLKF
ncbi:MAG TPA: hypothetical protein VKB68_19200 [Stellaceae bacterium]|nr:hypothetical protein [Stellaceae bacterium]